MKYFYRTFLTGNFGIGDHRNILFKEHLLVIREVSFKLSNSDIRVRECHVGDCDLCLSIKDKTRRSHRQNVRRSIIYNPKETYLANMQAEKLK